MLRRVRPPPFPPLAVLEEALAELPPPELEGAAIEAAVLVCLQGNAVLLARRALLPGLAGATVARVLHARDSFANVAA